MTSKANQFNEAKAASIEERRGALLILNRVRPSGSIYEGTVPAKVAAKRHQKARLARRANRARLRSAR